MGAVVGQCVSTFFVTLIVAHEVCGITLFQILSFYLLVMSIEMYQPLLAVAPEIIEDPHGLPSTS